MIQHLYDDEPVPRNPIFIQICASDGLPKPIEEYQFHDKRKWRIDFAFFANGRKVALEVEGGVWTNGRHTRTQGFLADMEKYNELALHGFILIRTTPQKLFFKETTDMIRRALYGELDGQ